MQTKRVKEGRQHILSLCINTTVAHKVARLAPMKASGAPLEKALPSLVDLWIRA